MRERHHYVPWPLKMAGALVLVPGILFLITWAAWMLWNALMPELFGLRALTYWQIMGLMVLVKLFIAGPRPHGPRMPFHRKPRFEDREAWRQHMKERFGPGSGHDFRHGREDFSAKRADGASAGGSKEGDDEV